MWVSHSLQYWGYEQCSNSKRLVLNSCSSNTPDHTPQDCELCFNTKYKKYHSFVIVLGMFQCNTLF